MLFFFFFLSDRFEYRDTESQNVLGDYYKVQVIKLNREISVKWKCSEKMDV